MRSNPPKPDGEALWEQQIERYRASSDDEKKIIFAEYYGHTARGDFSVERLKRAADIAHGLPVEPEVLMADGALEYEEAMLGEELLRD